MSERVFAVVSIYDNPGLIPHFLEHYTRLGVHQILAVVRTPDRGELYDVALAYSRPYPATVFWVATDRFADSNKAEVEQALLRENGLEPDDYVMHLDLDEFQEYPAPLAEVVRLMNDADDWALRGWILDRVAEDGSLAPVCSTPSIGEQFPIGCDLTAVVLGGWTQKIVLCRGRVQLQGGVRHDTCNAWYDRVPVGRPDQYLVHHFKWLRGLDQRLRNRLATAAIGPAYERECRRFLGYFECSERIDVYDLAIRPRRLGALTYPGACPRGQGSLYKVDELREWYRLYFRRFRELAPAEHLSFGYETGEPNSMAASLESLVCFANRIADPNVTVLNAGAGASSWVLRKLFPCVICTDPDRHYLRFIADLCGRAGLSTDGFIEPLCDCPAVDYTFYDYGHWDVRWPMLAVAWEKTRVAMYVDDTDDRPHNLANRAHVWAFARELALRIEDRKDATDGFGRWGSFLFRGC
jgi:hypothetical protein